MDTPHNFLQKSTPVYTDPGIESSKNVSLDSYAGEIRNRKLRSKRIANEQITKIFCQPNIQKVKRKGSKTLERKCK